MFRSVIFKTYQEMLQKKLQELKQKVFVVVLMDSNIIFWKYVENRGHNFIPTSKSIHNPMSVFSIDLQYFIYYDYTPLE